MLKCQAINEEAEISYVGSIAHDLYHAAGTLIVTDFTWLLLC